MPETAYQRIGREQAERQAARAEREAIRLGTKKPRKRRVSRRADAAASTYGSDMRRGEHTDDLGESHD